MKLTEEDISKLHRCCKEVVSSSVDHVYKNYTPRSRGTSDIMAVVDTLLDLMRT